MTLGRLVVERPARMRKRAPAQRTTSSVRWLPVGVRAKSQNRPRHCVLLWHFSRTRTCCRMTGNRPRGPTSLPYQGRPFQGSNTKMPGVTLTYTYDNMRFQQNLKGGLRVPWVPNPSGRPSTSPRTWNTVAISTGS